MTFSKMLGSNTINLISEFKKYHQTNQRGLKCLIVRVDRHVFKVGVYFLMFLTNGPWLSSYKGDYVRVNE